MNNRKIAILIDRLNVGGVEKIAIEQVRALRQLGEDAYLVVLSKKAVVKGAFKDLLVDVPIIYLDERLPFFLRFTFKFPIFYFFSFFHISYPFLIPFVVKNKEFDYIISHGTYTSFTAITLKKTRNISFSPFIWDPIGYILNKVYINKLPSFIFSILIFLANFIDKIIILNADVILAGGDAHNSYFKKLVPSKGIVIISPSVHPINRVLNKKDNYCLLVTAWKEGKNPEYIIDLIKNVKNLKVKIVGKWIDPLYEKKFKDLLKKIGLENKIDVMGEVTEKQLAKLYQEALFLLQINDDRGFGMPALEAAGNGTTFIIPKNQGVCKLFNDKEDGFFVKEKDTESIIKCISILTKNNNAQIMGKHAWRKVRDNYSWEKHAKILKNVYEQYVK